MNDKPTAEDEFKDNNNDCRDEESTARDYKPTARTSSKMTTTTVAMENPPQEMTSLWQAEDEFEVNNNDCRNNESTARDYKPTAEDKLFKGT
jgi:predicted methyltransferase